MEGLTAAQYRKKYVLSRRAYLGKLRRLEAEIFRMSEEFKSFVTPPDQVFKPNYRTCLLPGGDMFGKSDIEALNRFLDEIDDDCFFAVENPWSEGQGFCFPQGIEWEEYAGGGEASYWLAEVVVSDFHIFGPTDRWGIYFAEEWGVFIVGLKDEVCEDFIRHFEWCDKSLDYVTHNWIREASPVGSIKVERFVQNYIKSERTGVE